MRQFTTRVLSNKRIAPDHYILSFKTPKAAKKTKPGQFFNIKVDNSYNPLLRRPFGAHRIDGNKIEILYKVVGKATRILSRKKKSERLDIIGPLGNGFNINRARSRPAAVVLVAGGHGVAPLYALAETLVAAKPPQPRRLRKNLRNLRGCGGSNTSVMLGAGTGAHVVGEKRFRALGARVYVATEDGTRGRKGRVTDLLTLSTYAVDKKPCPPRRWTRVAIYACGPKAMLEAVAKFAARHGIPCQVSLEEYVACGIGTCLGCAVKTRSGYKLVCKDGPVFDSKEIIW